MNFYDYMYYSIMSVATIVIFGIGGFIGYCYNNNPDNVVLEIKYKAMNIGLWGINKYLDIQDNYNTYIKPYIYNIIYPTDDYTYIYIKYNHKPVYINNITENIIINNYNLLFKKIKVENNIYYKQVLTLSNTIQNPQSYNITYPFIQLELEYKGLKYELHKDIVQYGIEENILNKTFFIYFMKTYHNKKINYNDDFKIHYMDKNINMGTFSSNEYIILTNNNFDIYHPQ